MLNDGTSISTKDNLTAVKSSQWPELNFNELLNQKNIMFERYDFLMRTGSVNIAASILEGINILDSLIAQKSLK